MNARPSPAVRRARTAALWSASAIGILLQGGCSGMTPREKNTAIGGVIGKQVEPDKK